MWAGPAPGEDPLPGCRRLPHGGGVTSLLSLLIRSLTPSWGPHFQTPWGLELQVWELVGHDSLHSTLIVHFLLGTCSHPLSASLVAVSGPQGWTMLLDVPGPRGHWGSFWNSRQASPSIMLLTVQSTRQLPAHVPHPRLPVAARGNTPTRFLETNESANSGRATDFSPKSRHS